MIIIIWSTFVVVFFGADENELRGSQYYTEPDHI